jgi:hypothetical protein
MNRIFKRVVAAAIPILLLAPGLAWAAGGGGASELVVVADTRVISSDALRYFANLYNTNVTLFAVWAVVLTAAYGAFLGFLMDAIMKRTGIDLSKRTIIEH